MNWEDRIVADPNVLVGKPTIKGTRLSAEFILDRMADGWSEQMLLDNYPRLTKEDLRAVFAYATESLRDGLFVRIPPTSKRPHFLRTKTYLGQRSKFFARMAKT